MKNLNNVASKFTILVIVALLLCTDSGMAADINPYHLLKLSGIESAVAVQAISQQIDSSGGGLAAIRKSQLIISHQVGGYKAEFSPATAGGIRATYSITNVSAAVPQAISISGDFAAALLLASKELHTSARGSQDLSSLDSVALSYEGTGGPQYWVNVTFSPGGRPIKPLNGKFVTLGCGNEVSFVVNLETGQVNPAKPVC